MASPEPIIIDLLEGAGLTIYPDKVPAKGTYPCVVYQRISTPLIRTHVGDALEYPRIQLTCHAKTRKEANDTAAIVKGILTNNTTDFKLATKESELDNNDDETNLYSRILEYFIWMNA